MKNNNEKDLKDSIPSDEEIFFGKGGNQVDSSECFAKILKTQYKEHYFVWIWRGDVFDPYGTDLLLRSQNFIAKFAKVNKDVFENYIKYLKTKNRAYYNYARRNYRG